MISKTFETLQARLCSTGPNSVNAPRLELQTEDWKCRVPDKRRQELQPIKTLEQGECLYAPENYMVYSIWRTATPHLVLPSAHPARTSACQMRRWKSMEMCQSFANIRGSDNLTRSTLKVYPSNPSKCTVPIEFVFHGLPPLDLCDVGITQNESGLAMTPNQNGNKLGKNGTDYLLS